MNFSAYVEQTLQMIGENRLPHGIIVESESTANALFYVNSCARAILKTDNLDSHPDFFALHPSGKSNVIKIETVRELIDHVQKTPKGGDQKVFVIFEAHQLNKNAANALLKTLEEPPDNTTLFLVTSHKNFLSPTIISRCALHRLPENSMEILSAEFRVWMNHLELFLQKLQNNPEAINVLEIFALLEEVSRNMANFEKNNGENSPSIKDVYRLLLKEIGKIIWNIFHSKSPIYCIERSLKIVSKSSSILAFNGSFTHVIESILLQLYRNRLFEVSPQ
jgi:DNA polymerase III delta prime subunit